MALKIYTQYHVNRGKYINYKKSLYIFTIFVSAYVNEAVYAKFSCVNNYLLMYQLPWFFQRRIVKITIA